jgi:DNA polymerase-3 subunit delta
MLFLVHGDNVLAQEELVSSLVEEHADSDFADLGTEHLEPPLTLGDVRRACDTLPFMGGKRIVIIRNALSGKANASLAEEVAEYLERLPPTTLLVLWEERSLSKKHPVLAAVGRLDGEVRHATVPHPRDLPRWIVQRTRHYGASIDRGAVALLAQNIGPRLHQLDQEIRKVIIYRGDAGPITVEDVRVMVPYVESADVVFDMVDALGKRNPQIAARHLHRLLGDADEHPLRIFGMIVRQFRLLIQARWLMDRGRTEKDIVKRLRLHPYVGKKIRQQATYFNLEQLREAYRLLLDADLAMKTGRLDYEAALDLLVAQLTRLG